MQSEELIREIAIRACWEALQEKSQELAEDVARRMGSALAAQLEEPQAREMIQLSEELRQRNEELSALQGQVAFLSQHSQAQEEELRQRGYEVQQRTEELHLLNEELRQRTEALHARDEELRQRSEDLRSRDEELRQRTEELHAREEELRQRSEDLRTRDEQLRHQTEELADRDELLNQTGAQLRAREDELQSRTQELMARDEQLRERTEELTRRQEEASTQSPLPPPNAAEPAQLAKELHDGAVLIAGSRTQTETLETLLAATSAITPSCGLLILRGNQATGWSCHGLTDLDNFKRATMDCTRGIAATVIDSANAVETQVSQLDPVFVARLGMDASARVLLVPVLLKERVAALLMAVAEKDRDLAALELLVVVTQFALDLHSYRKAAQQPAAAVQAPAPPPRPAPAAPQMPSPVPVQPAMAASRVTAVASPPAAAPEPQPAYAAYAPVGTPPLPASPIAPPPFRVNVPQPPAAAPTSDEAHEKARRFAKLLVEEIKLYNQSKVAEGRARGDLYSRLREDIEKSRAAYDKRYGESVRDVDYFTAELLRILADNNPAVMGAGFPG